jgi:hypothetical protein
MPADSREAVRPQGSTLYLGLLSFFRKSPWVPVITGELSPFGKGCLYVLRSVILRLVNGTSAP